MKPDSPDPTLASWFERQRDADCAALPSFARLSSAAPSVPRGRRRPLTVTALAVLAVPALGIAVLRLQMNRRDANAATLPQTFAVSVAWQSPTDALLNDYTAAPLASLTPVESGAWTDELLPTQAARAEQ
jgi:hypothetical protein